jgi:surface polysaccharide O-acyltransferase-like enzyme
MKKGRDEDFWQKKTIATYILSVLVLLIHCSTFANYPNLPAAINVLSVFWQQVITPVAVPLFFIISGALFYRNYESDMKSYISKMKTRIRSLFVPYICWNVLNMMFQILCTELLSEYFVGREKFVFSAWNILGGVFHYKYNGPFWFIF